VLSAYTRRARRSSRRTLSLRHLCGSQIDVRSQIAH
jgi:hypothetical protein